MDLSSLLRPKLEGVFAGESGKVGTVIGLGGGGVWEFYHQRVEDRSWTRSRTTVVKVTDMTLMVSVTSGS